MIAPLAQVLAGGPAPAFTVYDLTGAAAAVQAAEARSRGLVLLVSSQAFQARTGPALLAGLAALAAGAGVPACVQLDHETDLGRIEAALAAGAGAVMADGSALAYEANVAFVAEARALAAAHGAQVEAELGRVEGDEEIAAAAAAGALTDPAQATDFVSRTGADCLAVSIGNVHGAYAASPELDWARLDAIRASVAVPLSLHGASGLSAGDLTRAVRGGIAKVNVNTELREAWLAAAQEKLPARTPGAQLLGLQRDLQAAVAAVAAAKFEALR